MRTMGLDVGTVTVGIALSDALGFIAQPLETFRFPAEHYKKAIQHISALVTKHQVSKIVVGMPKNMNGTIGPSGERSKAFKLALEKALDNVPIILWDERLTTVQAEKLLISANTSRKKRKQVIDTMAATLILENYLQSQ